MERLESCGRCNNGVIGLIPVVRKTFDTKPVEYIGLSREHHDRVRQQLHRRANTLIWQLAEFGRFDTRRYAVCSDVFEQLYDAGANNRFITSIHQLRVKVKYALRRCDCLAGSIMGDIATLADNEFHYLSELAKQRQREQVAFWEYYGMSHEIPTRFSSAFVRKISTQLESARPDAFYTDPYTGQYDSAGKTYNALRSEQKKSGKIQNTSSQITDLVV